jgi:exodeoxyribonuclease V beta subunit
MEKYLVLEANAGSGKTFSLVSRYLSLLFLGVKPERIFALTFTKKATKEMYDRVISSLQNPKSGEIQKIKDDLGVENIEEESKKVLKNLLNSEIKISTIDSFSNSILKRFAHYLEILPNFKVVERINEEKFTEFFLKNLSDTEIRAILEIEKLDKSMKIEKILEQLLKMYQKEIEIWRRLEQISQTEITINYQEYEKHILQLADLIAQNLLQFPKLSASGKKALTFSNLNELFSVGKTWLGKESLASFSYFKKAEPNQILETSFQKMKDLISRYFELKELLIFQNLYKLFQKYSENREKFLKREQKFSFDDINHFLTKLILDKNIDTQFIYFRLDSQIEHILIDEFQDTSILQYKILEPLIDDSLSGRDDSFKSVFYVGDKMQSLYRFRGAFPYLFDHLQNSYEVFKRDVLPNNYRSKFEIVNFINQTFGTSQKTGFETQKGGFVIVDEFENPLENVVDEVVRFVNLGVSPKDIAVICWKNSEVDLINSELEKVEIPSFPESNISLFDSPKVKAIINYLKFIYTSEKIYLKNFGAIIGISPEEKIETFPKFNVKTDSLLEIVLKIIETFKIFSDDEDILKFIQTLDSYGDFDEFIFNHEFEGGKSGSKKVEGVNIITIHKSKGLEYPFVIFIDTPQKSTDSDKSLYLYDGIETKNLLWNFGSTVNKINERYVKGKEELSEIEAEDTENRLYVALSRAKIGLKVLKATKKSNFQDLPVAVYGDFQKTLENYKSSVIDEVVENEEEFPIFEEKFYGRQNSSQNEEKNFDPEQIFQSYKKISFGSALHLTLEMMNSFDKKSLDLAIHSLKNSLQISENEIGEIRKRVLHLIENSEFQNLLKNGKIYREKGFRFGDKNFFMDLIVEFEEKIYVFDFKSSQKFQHEQIKQVKNYMNILESVYKKDVSGFLLYLESEKTEILKVYSETSSE